MRTWGGLTFFGLAYAFRFASEMSARVVASEDLWRAASTAYLDAV